MKRKLFITGIVILLTMQLNLYGEIEKSARATALSGAINTLYDINSIFYNPAGISLLTGYNLSLSFMPLYNVENLYYFRIAAVIPVKNFNLGIGLFREWLSHIYSENNFTATLSHSFSPYISSGINLKFNLINAPSKNDVSDIKDTLYYITFDIGAIIHIFKYLDISFTGANLTNPTISFSEEDLSKEKLRSFVIGEKINIRDYFYILLNEQFKENKEVIFNTGSELWLYNTVAVRIGFNENKGYSMGIGLKTGRINFDFGLKAYEYLGNLYQFDLNLRY